MVKKVPYNAEKEFDDVVEALIKHMGYAYAAGYLVSRLKDVMINPLAKQAPRTRDKAVQKLVSDLEHHIRVKVKNLMTGQEVEIRLADRGGPCDPSTERYFSM